MKTNFKLTGLSCEACVKLSAKRIERLAGVSGVAIDRDTGQTEVTAERPINLKEVNEALSGTDYQAVAN
jgi:copper chaperone CopZ